MKYDYLFGPVPSRRFGRSLGIDLVPAKTCSFDCPFCEVGRTTCSTCERAEYVPTEAVIAEFQRWLTDGGSADVITLCGSGEPTLHSRFGEIIDAIRSCCDTPIVLLTNSSLMHLSDVRDAAAKADIVKVSLSAWDAASFQQVNLPAAGVVFDSIVSGLQAFRRCFSGKLWVEVFLMKGVNDNPADVARISALVETIAPDAVQLNTVVRPPADASAGPLSREDLECLSPLFTPPAEIIARFKASAPSPAGPRVTAAHVLAMLTRRPCTLEDIAGAFGLEIAAVESLIKSLLADKSVHPVERSDGTYYAPSELPSTV
jgi:wyosine [tRNA(Phe)-imidazoG37] synthetase (radical SAM superfamily)